MELFPLKYATSTMTPYHFLALAIVAAVPLFSGWADGQTKAALQAVITATSIILSYAWMAPIVGQIFGDNFSWSQIWPSAFVLSFLMMAWGNFNFWV